MSDKKTSQKVKAASIWTVALVGCGNIGFGYDQGKAHGRPLTYFSAFYKHPAFKLLAVAEPRPTLRQEIADNFNVKAYADYKIMLRQERPEVVIIASPDKTHAVVVREAVKQKPRLIICEKPLALSSREVQSLVQLCQKHNIGLMVNFSRRFIEGFQKLHGLLKKQYFGRLDNINIYYSRGLNHNGSHYLDLILWYFGSPRRVMVEDIKPGLIQGDPTISCVLFYADFTVRLIGQTTGNLLINEIDIIGQAGRFKIDTFGQSEFFTVGTKKPYDGYRFYLPKKRQVFAMHSALQALLDNVSAYLNGHEQLLSPASNNLAVFKLINRIKKYGKSSN